MPNLSLPSNEAAFRALTAGDSRAYITIFENFDNFIKARAGSILNTFKDLTLDYNDLMDVGYTALMKAVKQYRDDERVPLAPYATVVITNSMLNAVKKIYTPTNLIHTRGVSLDETMYDNNTSLYMADSISNEDMLKDELGFYCPHAIDYYEDLIPPNLTAEECEIVRLKLEGYLYPEIQEKLSLTRRKLDALIQSIKTKWREYKS